MGPGTTSLDGELVALILRLAREIPRWGYQGIAGELAGLGMPVSATSVAGIPRPRGLPPAPQRTGSSWRAFLRQHPASMLACDFFTVDTAWLSRFYALFFIEIGSRRVQLAG